LLPTKPQYFQCLLCPDSIDIFYTFSAWCDKTFVAVDAYRSSDESNRSNWLASSFSSFPPFSLSLSLLFSFCLSICLSFSHRHSLVSRAIRRSIRKTTMQRFPKRQTLKLISGIVRARCSLPRKGCHPHPLPAWHFALCAFLSHNGILFLLARSLAQDAGFSPERRRARNPRGSAGADHNVLSDHS